MLGLRLHSKSIARFLITFPFNEQRALGSDFCIRLYVRKPHLFLLVIRRSRRRPVLVSHKPDLTQGKGFSRES